MKTKIDGAEEGLTHSKPIDAVKCRSSINKQNFLMTFHNFMLPISLLRKICWNPTAARHCRKPAADTK
jgi:hypothetical protein